MQDIRRTIKTLSDERPALIPIIIILCSSQFAVMRPSFPSLLGLSLSFVLLCLYLRHKPRLFCLIICFIFFLPLFYFSIQRSIQSRALARYGSLSPDEALRLEIRLNKISRRAESDYITAEGTVCFGPAKGLNVFLTFKSLPEEAEPGSVIQAKGRPDRLSAPRMPGEFDSAAYYAKRNIFFKFRAREVRLLPERSLNFKFRLLRRISACRRQLSRRLTEAAGREAGGLASAMLYGDKYYLDAAIEDEFKANGLSHILVTSGTHVSLCLLYIDPLKKQLGGLKPRLYLQLSVLLLLSILSLGSASILRASVMKFLELCGFYKGRRTLKDNYLYASILILILFKPSRAADRAFLMSAFAAQAVYLVPELEERGRLSFGASVKSYIRRKFFLYLRIQVFLMPFVLFFGRRLSLAEIAAQLFLLPLCSQFLFCSFALLVLGFIPLAAAWSGLALNMFYRLFVRLFSANELLSHISFRISRRFLCAVPWLILLLVIRRERRTLHRRSLSPLNFRRGMAAAAASLLLALGVFLRFRSFYGTFFLDVGQGDSSLIRLPGFSVLIDGGARGQGKRLQNFFNYSELDYLDLIIITHLDSDHAEGALELMECGFEVKNIWLSEYAAEDEAFPKFKKRLESLGKSAPKLQFIKAGSRLEAGEGCFRILGPRRHYEERNDESLCILFECGRSSVFFTGDAGFPAEKDLLEASLLKPADILHVSHHGADTGTSPELLEALCPSAAVISCGYENRYGHPAPALLGRLRAVPLLFRSDFSGSFHLPLKKDSRQLRVLAEEHYLPSSYAKIMGMEAGNGS